MKTFELRKAMKTPLSRIISESRRSKKKFSVLCLTLEKVLKKFPNIFVTFFQFSLVLVS